ncbi:ubiquinone biosynthesis accessory factor UbiJ [Kangiella sediminilitoris]|uniref:Ubiquinone biosynthesis accessory factor UbiJ n=1 Tax=Kangiella sediminilitoris TaxID=1144748 RepID=A0A1B3B8E5_9GAMM|nr:SCP2 sterol-binding domain-containing protein [Kangiella sediminilitoris]AOE49073.1 Sterol-binding domain protein [Kangiella sediminilitoris]
MLTELLAPTIETVINKVIKLDPEVSKKLIKLDQKVIAFHFTDIDQRLYFLIDQEYIVVKSHLDTAPHAELSGNLLSFFNLASSDSGDQIFKGEVHFSGEIGTAQAFQSFFSELDIDWEEHLSLYFGDIPAYHLVKAGESLKGWLTRTALTAQNNLSEYLRYEARSTPASIELENFYDDIADLKSDVERLAMRIERLHNIKQQTKES